MASSSLSILFIVVSTLSVLTVLHWGELENLHDAALRFLGSSRHELAKGTASAAVQRVKALLRMHDGAKDDTSKMEEALGLDIAEKSLQTKADQAENWLKTLQLERQSLRKRRQAASSAASALTKLGSFQAEHGRPNAAILGLQRAVKIIKKVVVEEEDKHGSTTDPASEASDDGKGSELVIAAKAEAALADALCAAGGEKGSRQMQAKALFGEALQTVSQVKHEGSSSSNDESFKVLSAEVHASLAHCLHLNGDLSTAAAMLRVASAFANEVSARARGRRLIPRLARLMGGLRHDEGSTDEAIRLYEEYLATVPEPQRSASDGPSDIVEVFETLQDHALATASIGNSEQSLRTLDDVRVLQERLNAKFRSRQGRATFLKDEGSPDLALLGSMARTWQLRAEILLNNDVVEGDRRSHLHEAVAASAQAIPILKKLKEDGEGLRQLSDALNTHGNALTAVGRAAEAEAAYRQALDLSRELHGDINPLTAAMLHNVGAALAKQGDNKGALEVLNESLAILRQTLGDNPDVSAALASIASILRKQGKIEESLTKMQEALRIAVKTLPADHNSRKQYEMIVERWEQQEMGRRGQVDDVIET